MGAIQRVAIVFDNTIRQDTIGLYCLNALENITHVEHFIPSDFEQIPRDGFDLYLNIDDGLDYSLPKDLRPWALWGIDTHLQPNRIIDRARGAEFVFSSQRNGVQLFQQHGVQCCGWLPLACDPKVHQKHDIPKTLDVCFVAHLNDKVRIELASLIERTFSNTFVGQRPIYRCAAAWSISQT